MLVEQMPFAAVARTVGETWHTNGLFQAPNARRVDTRASRE